MAADPVLKMTERIHDPREFIKMDDTLVKQIENYSLLHPHFEDSDDSAPIMASQKIITRSATCLVHKSTDMHEPSHWCKPHVACKACAGPYDHTEAIEIGCE